MVLFVKRHSGGAEDADARKGAYPPYKLLFNAAQSLSRRPR
jgi:hypothetical protein